jgi:tRNA1(Val) A37 N6-methylase TrmN6
LYELVRTNNAVLITAIEALLKGAAIPHMVLDRHMSVLEGSLGMLPRRIVVDAEHWEAARQVLTDAGLTHELRPTSSGPDAKTTDDAVLGGRLRIVQKKRGHRVGHDAILLAAATAARPGDRVVEFGAGVGGAGLALAVRCPDVDVTLIELDAELSAIATENVIRNGLGSRVRVVTLDVTSPADELSAHGIMLGFADRVLMNPPFNDPARQNVSPDPDRRAAHVAGEGSLAQWIGAAERILHSAGGLTLIWRADGLADVLAALDVGFGEITVLPVHGRAGAPAIRVLVNASKGSRTPLRLLPGLNLNDDAGRPTEAAEAVLRDAKALPSGD